MDHKVSKDMISSGMIPSGEKTQADLGRTQYGSAPSPSKLMDAYKSMYEHHQKDENGNTIPHEDEENLEEMTGGLGISSLQKLRSGIKSGEIKQKPVVKKETETSTSTVSKPKPKLSGKERAQAMAKARIASGKTIADVKSANTTSMRDRARARNAAFQAKRAERRNKPMSSNPQGMRQQGVGKSANDLSRHSSGSSTSALNVSATRRPMGRSAAKRRSMMNDVDLFDLIKGAFIEEGYTESDALAFMVEASPEYLAELDRELTMLGAGLASIPAIAATAKKIFKPKVDKAIDKQRKTSNIGGDKRAGVGMKESAGVFADPKLNKKYPDQPKMTEKGKKILPNLPDPEGLGSRKTSKPAFGISKSTNDALKMLK